MGWSACFERNKIRFNLLLEHGFLSFESLMLVGLSSFSFFVSRLKMSGSVNVNLSGKFEINLSCTISFSSDSTSSDDFRSILRPIERPEILALTDISESETNISEAEPNNFEPDMFEPEPDVSEPEFDTDEESEVFRSLTEILSTMARPRSPTPECLSLSPLDPEGLRSPSFGENWLNPMPVFGPEIVASLTEAFSGILAELDGFETDDDDVVFLYEVKRSWKPSARIPMSFFSKQASLMIWKNFAIRLI